MDINKILETLIPLVIVLLLGWVGKIIYNNRKILIIKYKRMKLKLFPIQFNLALSLDFEEGLNTGKYFKEIKKNFQKIIISAGVEKYIKLIDFSDIYKFANKTEAENFRQKKNISLIAWGDFSNDYLKKNGKNLCELDMHFTFGHPDNENRDIGKMLLLDINSKLAIKKYWKIIDGDSSKDIKIISNNLFDITTYIIALCLKISGNICKSVMLFEKLYNKLIKYSDDFSSLVIPHLNNCYHLIIDEYGIGKKKYKIGKEYCIKILKFNKYDFHALVNIAVFQFKLGEIEVTEKTIKTLQDLYPRNPITEVDVAFIRAHQKKYSDSFKHYENLTKFKYPNFNPLEVVEFLSDQYDLYKEPAFLYGSGIISYYFVDQIIGKEDFKKFISIANEDKYKSMYRKAKKLLKK